MRDISDTLDTLEEIKLRTDLEYFIERKVEEDFLDAFEQFKKTCKSYDWDYKEVLKILEGDDII